MHFICFFQLETTLQRTPALLAKVITQSLDQEAFGVVSSRAPPEFLAQCVIVDQKPGCKKNFPAQRVLLSPAYRNIALVDRTSDTRLAAQEIAASRLMFGGASSYAVDLVLVNEFIEAEFREALSRVLAEARLTESLTNNQTQMRGRIDLVVDGEDSLCDKQVKRGEATFIRGDSSHGVLQVLDRQEYHLTSPSQPMEVTDSLCANRSCPVVCRKLFGSRVIVYTTVTSLDDAIDFLGTEAQQATPIGALYLFAQSREGKYLSQYIESRATYTNHVPAELSSKTTLYPTYVMSSLED
jgi:acyl-CoA reductase-like NAD-dependent aldehyde dehydrogenase